MYCAPIHKAVIFPSRVLQNRRNVRSIGGRTSTPGACIYKVGESICFVQTKNIKQNSAIFPSDGKGWTSYEAYISRSRTQCPGWTQQWYASPKSKTESNNNPGMRHHPLNFSKSNVIPYSIAQTDAGARSLSLWALLRRIVFTLSSPATFCIGILVGDIILRFQGSVSLGERLSVTTTPKPKSEPKFPL